MYKCKCGGMVTDCIGELEDSNNPCICKDLKIESQAKEIEGLREWKDKAIKLIEPSIEQSKGVLEDCDSEYWSDRANKIIDEGKNLLSQDTTQPDTKQKD